MFPNAPLKGQMESNALLRTGLAPRRCLGDMPSLAARRRFVVGVSRHRSDAVSAQHLARHEYVHIRGKEALGCAARASWKNPKRFTVDRLHLLLRQSAAACQRPMWSGRSIKEARVRNHYAPRRSIVPDYVGRQRVLGGVVDFGEGLASGRGLSPAYPVRTARLDLRPHRRDDLEDLLAFHSRPEVVRYLPWPVRDREQTRSALEAKLAQGVVTEPGQWLVLAMEMRETSTVIGEVLLKWESDANRQGEIGFAVHTAHHRRGLAAEAAEAVLRLGFDDLALHRIVAVCIAANVDSVRLLRRLGMQQEAHLRDNLFFKGKWADQLVFGLLADEWRGHERPGANRRE